jgi:hypothetical protein
MDMLVLLEVKECLREAVDAPPLPPLFHEVAGGKRRASISIRSRRRRRHII